MTPGNARRILSRRVAYLTAELEAYGAESPRMGFAVGEFAALEHVLSYLPPSEVDPEVVAAAKSYSLAKARSEVRRRSGPRCNCDQQCPVHGKRASE